MTTPKTPTPLQPLTDEELMAAARRLREEENSRLHVRPWRQKNRTAWRIAVPAACLVGFALGFWLRPSSETGGTQQPVAQTVVKSDTVYVREVVHDTIYQTTDPHRPVRPLPLTASSRPSSQPDKTERIGVSMLEDGIRYDLLASRP